jgi:hypothetical protein
MSDYWFSSRHAFLSDLVKLRRDVAIRNAHASVRHSDRIRALEDELGKVSLLAFALAQVCLDTGLVTLDELKDQLRKMDLSDGTEDGKLAPGRPLPGSPPAPPVPETPAPPPRRTRFRPRT